LKARYAASRQGIRAEGKKIARNRNQGLGCRIEAKECKKDPEQKSIHGTAAKHSTALHSTALQPCISVHWIHSTAALVSKPSPRCPESPSQVAQRSCMALSTTSEETHIKCAAKSWFPLLLHLEHYGAHLHSSNCSVSPARVATHLLTTVTS
jgi:hypothetical protein